MPTNLSIVIPTLNAAKQLPGLIACLAEAGTAGLRCELIVSDGQSDDETAQVADALGAKVVVGAAGRGGQLGRGALRAEGEWLLFLHADTRLTPGWAKVVQNHISTSTRAGYFGLRFRAQGIAPVIVAGWANVRSRMGLPYGDQGLLIGRELYSRVGGYQDIPLMEDVAMVRALKGKLTRLAGYALTDAEKYLRDGWFWRGGRNMRLLLRYLMGADPAALAKPYVASSASENCKR